MMMRLFSGALVLVACIDDSSSRVTTDTGGTDTVADTGATSATDTASTPDTSGEPCSSPGETRCDETASAIAVCSDGRWQATSCGQGRVCIDLGGAQCLESSGDGACREMVYCYLACGVTSDDGDECALECYLGGTVEAQVELAAFNSCMERAACANAGSVDDVFACVDTNCSTQLAQCYFPTSGAKSCATIIACREACGEDEACQLACGSDATLAAQGTYGVLELCLFYACAEADTEEERTACFLEATGINGACSPYVRACANPLND